MLLKGAYCVGEHFVDPQRAVTISKHEIVSSDVVQKTRFLKMKLKYRAFFDVII